MDESHGAFPTGPLGLASRAQSVFLVVSLSAKGKEHTEFALFQRTAEDGEKQGVVWCTTQKIDNETMFNNSVDSCSS